jgi:hypothetical protein
MVEQAPGFDIAALDVLHKDQFKCYQEHGVHYICEKTGRSFLQTYLWACKKIDIDLLVQVIAKDKVNVRHVAKNGKTAMYFACCNSEKTLEVLKLLYFAGASVVQCTSEGQDSLAVYKSQVLPPDPLVVIWLFAMGC